MNKKICSRCVCDKSVSGIRFLKDGTCNYCKIHDRLEKKFFSDKNRFDKLMNKVKKKGKRKKYDVIVGVSGGRDSLYSLFLLKKKGLRPLAVHFDNGWVSDTARNNIKKAIRKLDVDLLEYSFGEIKDMYKACLLASVPDVCLPCSIGIGSSLYRAAEKYDVRYIAMAISFKTEGVNPLRENYCDGKYFENIMRMGRVKRKKGYNKMKILDYIRYVFFKRIKIIQLPFYIEYDNKKIDKILKKELGWKYGGRHHFDCEYKPLVSFIRKDKHRFDDRRICLSAMIRTGQISRESALNQLKNVPKYDKGVKDCLKKMDISYREFENIRKMNPKYFYDYPNHYKFISKFKPLFKILAKMNLLPETIYEKLFDLK